MAPTRAPRRARAALAAAGGAVLLLAAGVIVWPSIGTPGAWVDAWAASPDSAVLMVRAVGQSAPAGQCGPPQVHFSVDEDERAVRVTARYLRILPSSGACAAVGYGPSPHAVALRAPIGDRVVVDATSDQQRPLLHASAAATITSLPPGYETVDLSRETVDGAEMIRRQWRGPGGFVLLTTQQDSSRRLLYHREVVRYEGLDVRFHVHEDEPRDVYYLEWRMPSGTQANVDLHLRHGTWTPQQALAVVRSTTDAVSS